MEVAELRIAEAVETGAETLNLSGLDLSEVPVRLRKLTGLIDLDLSFNRITALPDFIGGLRGLRNLNLQRNGLLFLPRRVGDLSRLTRLQLHSNGLRDVPRAIGQLVRLEELALGGNRIERLPGFLLDLHRLNSLDLYGNEITELPHEFESLQGLTDLDLGGNRLTGLPGSIGECSGLTRLVLSGNSLNRIPEEIGALKRLTHLNLSRNDLGRFPNAVVELENLTHLDLGGNRIRAIPADIRRLTRLTHLNLSGNRLRSLPDEIGELRETVTINLQGNRLTDLPPSLARATSLRTLAVEDNDLSPELKAASTQGTKSVLTYLREQAIASVAVREAKLVVIGEGAVGKSSLLAALRGEAFVEQRPLTHGLEVGPVNLADALGRPLTLNAWDFGGQSTNRPVHQLFFTSWAVYVIAWNPRSGAAQGFVEYWVNLVRRRVGAEARIHIVATHADAHDHLGDLDRTRLQRKADSEIAGFHRIDSKTGRGIAELASAIATTAADLQHLERRLPARWRAVMEELAEGGESHLAIDDYLGRTRSHGLDDDSALTLARVATELGHWCYFPDAKGLDELVVLKGDWLSRAISLALNDPVTRDREGLVSHDRLRRVWDDPRRPEHERYPRRVHSALIELMHEFEIAYPVRDSYDGPTSLITQLVSTVEPDLEDWTRYDPGLPEQSYVIEFRDASDRPAKPEGLMFRLIARFHRFALQRGDLGRGVHWASGVVLDDGNHGRALVRIENDRLSVTVKAAYPTYLCKLLADEICNHLPEWKGLTRVTRVPCGAVCAAAGSPKAGSMLFDLEALQSFKAEGHVGAACNKCNQMVPLDALIGEFGAIAGARSESEDGIVADIQARLDSLRELVDEQGSLTRAHVSTDLRRAMTEADTRVEELIEMGFRLLADDGMHGPRLFTVTQDDSGPRIKGLAQQRIRVILHCEHSRRPVHLLDGDPDKGVYTFDMDREWLTKARPWINFTARMLRLGGELVPAGLRLELASSDWKGIENEVGLAASAVKELASNASDLAAWKDADADLGGEAQFDELSRGRIHRLRALVEQQDPDFAGLVRVRSGDRFRWVHKDFADRYR
ncbi:leucine-rich repeat domain-containing protein [Glycomyces algeriensis]|nr:leucine-rich repeat domain-containing protein [Glycomyces algeriensis]MDA1368333.1 leucine-rich repeat domain-containing protein [Glycomyces algeriensis]MDR7351774.1 Leucine-rich repeat (LRR) protein/GTPase SAR1 family protein [Glycomyces algeriensis]